MQLLDTATPRPPADGRGAAPAASPRKAGRWRRLRAARWSYLYLAPLMALLLTFVVYPIFGSLAYTFYRWNGIGCLLYTSDAADE